MHNATYLFPQQHPGYYVKIQFLIRNESRQDYLLSIKGKYFDVQIYKQLEKEFS